MLTIKERNIQFDIDLYSFKYRNGLLDYVNKLITIFILSETSEGLEFKLEILNKKIDLVEITFIDERYQFEAIYRGNFYLLTTSILTSVVSSTCLSTYTHDIIDLVNSYRRMRELDIKELILKYTENNEQE